MDFTLNKYKLLIHNITKNNIPVYSIKDWIIKKPKSGIVLRHDVDRNPENSLKVAKLESENNIHATYYFRMTKNSFNIEIIRKIANLGHEIGYHYEDLSLAKGNYNKAIGLFKVHLQKITNIAPVKTIAMHGRPLSPYDSRDLWKKYNFKEFDLLGEAFLSINYSNIYYFTDTGRSWSNNSANIRDTVENNLIANIKTTDELIKFIVKNKNDKFAIVSHPERWASSKITFMISYCFDCFVNFVKKIIIIIRKINFVNN
jgi:hypothetical protein